LPATKSRAVAEVEAGGVLVSRQSEKGHDYLLLDPMTGKSRRVTGEFRPLEQQSYRALQSDGKGRFWAAIPEKKEGAVMTRFGLYDARQFTFTPLLELPEIEFDSMNLWVDGPAGRLYVAYHGHLLRIPFAKQ
jgi:hypothetical protein